MSKEEPSRVPRREPSGDSGGSSMTASTSGLTPASRRRSAMPIEAAQKAGQRGAAAQVLVQGRNGSFVAEWTYGQDPYPPDS